MEAQNTFIASFDFKSVFTNVPLEDVIEICVDTMYKISKPTVSRMNIKKLLKLAISASSLV